MTEKLTLFSFELKVSRQQLGFHSSLQIYVLTKISIPDSETSVHSILRRQIVSDSRVIKDSYCCNTIRCISYKSGRDIAGSMLGLLRKHLGLAFIGLLY